MKKPYLSVIIPCYNEEQNIKNGTLSSVHDYLKKQNYLYEVIVSDDGSTDNSSDLITQQIKDWKNFKLLKNPHGGKPSALLYGIKNANAEFILFTDMDQSTPIDQIDKLTTYISKDFDVVIGSRGVQRKNFPIYRRLGAVVFMGIRKALILPEINDTQCGFKLFESIKLKKAFPKLEFFKRRQKVKGWKVTSYDVELLQILKKMGCKIKEVKVKWNDEDKSGSKGGNISRYLRESKEMFMQILRVKLNEINGYYD
ncbi:glycosyltransferase [Candidatus Woesebacteria bacterium]|nr:glycosyltransferase [Candidatus Woesebacteria bacterium]